MRWYLCYLLLFLASCKSLDIERRYVSSESLASEYVGSPDRLKKDPPTGEQLWIYWNLPSSVYEPHLVLSVRVVYKNLEEEVIAYPVTGRKGHQLFEIVGESYKKRGGILTYSADISTIEGERIERFTQQMWFGKVRHMHL